MASPEKDRIFIHTNGIQMDLDLQKQIFIPNPLILVPVKLDDSSFILFYCIFLLSVKGGFALHLLEPVTTTALGGAMGGGGVGGRGRSSNANILQLSAAGGNSLTERRTPKRSHKFISLPGRSKHPTAEVTCENKCLHRKAERKASGTHLPKQKQERL